MLSNENFNDEYLVCEDCGGEFLFTAEDQEFFNEKRFSAPKRCPDCRSSRKQARLNQRGGGSGGGYNKPKYTVICSQCGIETTVPFEPSGNRPVFCRDCYRNQ